MGRPYRAWGSAAAAGPFATKRTKSTKGRHYSWRNGIGVSVGHRPFFVLFVVFVVDRSAVSGRNGRESRRDREGRPVRAAIVGTRPTQLPTCSAGFRLPGKSAIGGAAEPVGPAEALPWPRKPAEARTLAEAGV